MAQRLQSPSSINLFRQCARKYFYQYILKLPTKKSIHLVRGVVAHQVLEDFFKLDPEKLPSENYEFILRTLIQDMLNKEWIKEKEKFDELGMNEHDLEFYRTETKEMFENWVSGFITKLNEEMQTKSFKEAFKHLTPITEKYYHSESHQVRGYIDAIHEWGDNVHILDYKTSKRAKISPEYRLQLGIYAMMYQQEHGVKPTKVGINFLKFDELYIAVDDALIKEAEVACHEIQEKTKFDNIENYPKTITPLCKWSTGQCDFYERCNRE
ncbi:PD-(D/E)XK nuclease family protein [Candidatus Woesearchaeota archaeon]|nr:PD-(D/E)XK nuclease family protein [Candidatus Woesearchaeota archaeon]